MDGTLTGGMSFGARFKLAWRVLWDGALARRVVAVEGTGATETGSAKASIPSRSEPAVAEPAAPVAVQAAAPAPAPTPERVHASGLQLLAALQREGRLVDFLEQDVTAFSDEDVAGAARVVHAGCRRVLRQGLELAPAVADSEGTSMTVPAGFDAHRIRLTGNVTGNPPFRGVLRHPGWVVRQVRFPEVSASMDPRILAPAEVELP